MNDNDIFPPERKRRRAKCRWGTVICEKCGQRVSLNGLAQASHIRKHQREELEKDVLA